MQPENAISRNFEMRYCYRKRTRSAIQQLCYAMHIVEYKVSAEEEEAEDEQAKMSSARARKESEARSFSELANHRLG